MPRSSKVVRQACLAIAAWLVAASLAGAQPAQSYNLSADRQVRIGENHIQLVGSVEIVQGDTKVFADHAEFFTDEHRVVASGNVVFSQGSQHIAADRADFNSETRLGTFTNAWGVAAIKPPRQTAPVGGFVAPQLTAGDTEVYFFGETIEKIGAKKYRITKGGFSTCVQPTPRWDFTADVVVLHIDHYTLLRQALLNVKGVPVLYLPFLYYPTKEEERATGFLLPTYGVSTLRGQTIHNAFFWAINRSHDATIMWDWFSKSGQGLGTEYRYNLGGGSDGTLRSYVLDQRETVYVSGSAVSTLPATKSYDIRGAFNQNLPARLRARGSVDYFSSVTTMQTFNTDVYNASRNQRSYGGNVVGAWRTYSLSGTLDRREYFNNTTSSTVQGGTPRVTLTRNERPIVPGAPIYVAASTEYAHLIGERRSGDVVESSTLSRVDFAPQVRYPFKRWQWFTVNSSLAWRDTFYTRRIDPTAIDPATNRPRIVDETVNRRYVTMLAQAVGPVLNRIWDTPSNGYAERFKHTIEPFVNVSRTSAIGNFDRIVQNDGIDGVYGGTTSYTYGVNNRLYAKRKTGSFSQAQEIVSVALLQSYYTDARASQYDRQFTTTLSGAPPSHFSPISLAARAMPTASFNARLTAEFDSREHELRKLSVDGSYDWRNRVQSTVGWSHKFFIEKLAGFNDPRFLDHFLIGSTSAHTLNNRVGTTYSFNFDVLRSTMLQQRLSSYYNAQCCGIAVEYQQFNFSGINGFPLPSDRRFFLSFTLAGLGNFSPFSGGLSGVPR